MSSIFDEAFDYNDAAAEATASRTDEAQKRFKSTLGSAVSTLKRQANIARKQMEDAGGDEADVFNAMAAAIEGGYRPAQAAVTTDSSAQALPAHDIIDAQVAGLEEELRNVRTENDRLTRENDRLDAEAVRVSNLRAERDAARDEVRGLNQRVADLTAELNQARERRDAAENQLNTLQQRQREARAARPGPTTQRPPQQPAANQQQAQQPQAAPQQSGRHTDEPAPQQSGRHTDEPPAAAPVNQAQPAPQQPAANQQQAQQPQAAAPQRPANPPTQVIPAAQRPAQPAGNRPGAGGILGNLLPSHNRNRGRGRTN